MTKDRMIEILAEEMSKDTQIKIGQPFKLCSYDDALTAMQRAVEEETKGLNTTISALNRFRVEDAASALNEQNRLRAEITRLRECEAIVRELAQMSILDGDSEFVMLKYKARQWVKENTIKTE